MVNLCGRDDGWCSFLSFAISDTFRHRVIVHVDCLWLFGAYDTDG